MKRFRGGLVFKALRRVYHSTLGSRVISNNNKKKKTRRDQDCQAPSVRACISPQICTACVSATCPRWARSPPLNAWMLWKQWNLHTYPLTPKPHSLNRGHSALGTVPNGRAHWAPRYPSCTVHSLERWERSTPHRSTSSSVSLTSNLFKSDQLLTTHRSPSTRDRAPLLDGWGPAISIVHRALARALGAHTAHPVEPQPKPHTRNLKQPRHPLDGSRRTHLPRVVLSAGG